MNAALLVIDVQAGLVDPEPRPFEIAQVIARINELSARARAAGAPVIFIQHERDGSPVAHGSPGWALQRDLQVGEADHFVRKTSPDSFLRTGLEDLLRRLGVGRLVICGCFSEFCVDTTVRRAAALGFPVTLAADAHTTRDQPHASAALIRAHENATLPAIASFNVAIRAMDAAAIGFASLRIAPCDPETAEVVALLQASDAYMGALYPAESNHLVSPAELKRGNTLFLGAFLGERLVGCGAVRILQDDGHYGEIKRVYVPTELRGYGAAKALMARLEAHLVAQGVPLARLETGIHQPEALGLYRRLGYRERPPFGAYRPDPLSLFMEKPLGIPAR